MLKLRTLGQTPVIQQLNPGEYTPPYITYGGTLPGSTTYAEEYTPAPPNSPTTPLTAEDRALLAQGTQSLTPPAAIARGNANVPGIPGTPQNPIVGPQQAGMILGFTTNQIIVAGIVGFALYSFVNKG